MKNKILFIAFLSLGLTFSSCDTLLDTEPSESIDLQQAIQTYSGLRGILLDTYDDMRSRYMWGSQYTCIPDMMADNLLNLRFTGWYEWAADNTWTLGEWPRSYTVINQTNIILANADQLMGQTGVTEAEIDQLKGEAHVLRAMLYFMHVNAYAYIPTAIVDGKNRGGVPLLLDPVTALGDINPQERAPIGEVYAQIMADLDAGIQLLDDEAANTAQQGFVGKTAAQALLSRVALYAGEWQTVVDQATAVLESGQGTLSIRESYAADWDAALHPEALFIFIYQTNEPININVALQRLYTSVNKRDPGYAGRGSYVPSDSYLVLLDSSDVRNQILQMGQNGRLETTKFTGDGGANDVDNIPVIRLSEVYLNRAEAYAQLGMETEAIADLDLIRQRSFGPGFTPTTASGAALLEAIYLERRLELAFEGHRWYDLKRWGQDLDKRDLTGEYIEFETDFRWLAPIPQQEIELNPFIEQNPGWN